MRLWTLYSLPILVRALIDGPRVDRRRWLQQVLVGATTASSSGSVQPSLATAPSSDFSSFSITGDAGPNLSPKLTPVDKSSFFRRILRDTANGGTLWLGEHHNAVRDHQLQANIVRELHRQSRQPLAIGLEQVQVQFQPALDAYVAGEIGTDTLREQVQWDKRWIWPWRVYEPVFSTAQELGIPLIALNVDSEDLALVEKKGLPGLDRAKLAEYITDARGFADFASHRRFSAYVDYVIQPSYQLHEAMGLLQYTMNGEKLDTTMPFRNFLSSRILWDEAMAGRAYQWTKAHPKGLLIGLVGADHVKFCDGIPGRYARLAGDAKACTSVVLNPTLIDSRPSGSVASIEDADSNLYPDRLTLQLRYLKDGVDVNSVERSLPSSTGGVLPFADYILIGAGIA